MLTSESGVHKRDASLAAAGAVDELPLVLERFGAAVTEAKSWMSVKYS